jgi:hypothetical protein
MCRATLGIPKTQYVPAETGCVCRHLEYDQPPEVRAYLIARKVEGDIPTADDPIRLRPAGRDDLPRMCDPQLDPEPTR